MMQSKKGSRARKTGQKRVAATKAKKPKVAKKAKIQVVKPELSKGAEVAHPSFSLENGGEEISADRIKFVPRESPQVGYFDILVDGVKVTCDDIRGGLHPESVATGTTMAGFLIQGHGPGAQFAIFANGKVGRWSPKDKGVPKVLRDPETGDLRLRVGEEEHLVRMQVTKSCSS